MRIGIVGLGAIGGLMATALAPHAEVHVFARGARGAHALAEGLVLEGLFAHRLQPADVTVHLPELDHPAPSGLDVVLLAVKAHQVDGALERALPSLSNEGVVAYLGNGLASSNRCRGATRGVSLPSRAPMARWWAREPSPAGRGMAHSCLGRGLQGQ